MVTLAASNEKVKAELDKAVEEGDAMFEKYEVERSTSVPETDEEGEEGEGDEATGAVYLSATAAIVTLGAMLQWAWSAESKKQMLTMLSIFLPLQPLSSHRAMIWWRQLQSQKIADGVSIKQPSQPLPLLKPYNLDF